MPKWEPGKLNGNIVRVQTNLLINFKLRASGIIKNNIRAFQMASQINPSRFSSQAKKTLRAEKRLINIDCYWPKR